MSTGKADKPNEEKRESGESAPAPANAPKSVREVVVTHLDAPPPSGKQSIHPRRPAPIVPTRERRTGQVSEDTDAEKPASES